MSARLHDGQWYVECGRLPYARRDGTETTLVRWLSQCAECGGEFTFSTPISSKKFQPNRRCRIHRQPGHRVRRPES